MSDPFPAAAQLARELKALYETAGRPPLDALVRAGGARRPPVKLTPQSLSDWINGKSVPSGGSRAALRFLVAELETSARGDGHRPHHLGWWERLRAEAEREKSTNRGARPLDPAAPLRPTAAGNEPADRGRPTAAHLKNQWFDLVTVDTLRSAGNGRAERFIARTARWSDVVGGESPDSGFIERDQTGEILNLALESLVARSPRESLPLLTVTGSPGAGKTTLVKRVAAELVGQGRCVVADFGTNRRPLQEPDVEHVIARLLDAAEAFGPVLLLLDDPFKDNSAFVHLLERLAAVDAAGFAALAASPTLLFDRHAWNIRYGIDSEHVVLHAPTERERRTLAALYGRDPERYADRADDLLVLTLEVSSGRDVREIVRRMWETLNDGEVIDPRLAPHRLPWLVRAYLLVAALHAEDVPTPEEVLQQILVHSSGQRVDPDDIRFAVTRLVSNDGWHIFQMGRRAAGAFITTAHPSIARLANEIRPAQPFDPLAWLFTADLLDGREAPWAISAVLLSIATTDRERALGLLARLADGLTSGLLNQRVTLVSIVHLAVQLESDVRLLDALITPIRDLLVEFLRDPREASWLALQILQLYHTRLGLPALDVPADERLGVSADEPAGPREILLRADFTLAPDRARLMFDAARDAPEVRSAMLQNLMRHLSQGDRRGTLSPLINTAIHASGRTALIPYLGRIVEHLDRYPYDAVLRQKALEVALDAPADARAAVAKLVRDTQAWLAEQPESTLIRTMWLRLTLSSGDVYDRRRARASLARWLAEMTISQAAVMLQNLLAAPYRRRRFQATEALLRVAVDYCQEHLGQTQIAPVVSGIVRAYKYLLRRPDREAETNRLLGEAHDLVALYYWENFGKAGPALPSPRSPAPDTRAAARCPPWQGDQGP
ncbi:hypothetical protein [Plantactinospora sp. CA-290183]|uniref:hypothetical protein n=1 Tax=Plantactinospora sp. CA-290183 TaxID=3240006 RepID=UPI003D9263EE